MPYEERKLYEGSGGGEYMRFPVASGETPHEERKLNNGALVGVSLLAWSPRAKHLIQSV